MSFSDFLCVLKHCYISVSQCSHQSFPPTRQQPLSTASANSKTRCWPVSIAEDLTGGSISGGVYSWGSFSSLGQLSVLYILLPSTYLFHTINPLCPPENLQLWQPSSQAGESEDSRMSLQGPHHLVSCNEQQHRVGNKQNHHILSILTISCLLLIHHHETLGGF